MNSLRKLLGKTLTILCATSLISLVFIVLLGIASNQLKLKITWTEEAANILLTWTVMLGGALAYLEHAHLGVDVLTSNFTPQALRAVKIFTTLVVIIFSAWIMIHGGWQLFQNGLASNQKLPSLGIRKAWFYLSVPVSGGLIVTFALDNLRRLIWNIPESTSEIQPDSQQEVAR